MLVVTGADEGPGGNGARGLDSSRNLAVNTESSASITSCKSLSLLQQMCAMSGSRSGWGVFWGATMSVWGSHCEWLVPCTTLICSIQDSIFLPVKHHSPLHAFHYLSLDPRMHCH
jgi:hypothetical protein